MRQVGCVCSALHLTDVVKARVYEILVYYESAFLRTIPTKLLLDHTCMVVVKAVAVADEN